MVMIQTPALLSVSILIYITKREFIQYISFFYCLYIMGRKSDNVLVRNALCRHFRGYNRIGVFCILEQDSAALSYQTLYVEAAVVPPLPVQFV